MPRTSTSPSRISIVRGTITSFEKGIDLTDAVQIQIQSVTIYGVSVFGIKTTNSPAIIGDNIVHTTGVGIIVGCPANLIQNVVEDNPGGNLITNGNGCNKVDNLGF